MAALIASEIRLVRNGRSRQRPWASIVIDTAAATSPTPQIHRASLRSTGGAVRQDDTTRVRMVTLPRSGPPGPRLMPASELVRVDDAVEVPPALQCRGDRVSLADPPDDPLGEPGQPDLRG